MARVVGVPREIKDQEGRVSMQPDGVAELVHHGREVIVESGAGLGAGFEDEEYEKAGARLVDGPEEVFASAELIVKVKEPIPARARSSSRICTSRRTGSSPSS
jgi:alanine dehydrogenase